MAALPILQTRLSVAAEERAIRQHIKDAEAVLMRTELKAMRRVLRRLGHLSEEGIILNKGRVACELSTAHELITTELVFSGLLNELEPNALAALLSCLVCEGKGASKGGQGGKGGGKSGAPPDAASLIKTKTMLAPFERLREHARRVASTMEECRVEVDPKEFVEKEVSPDLLDAVVEWCDGAKFADIAQSHEFYEGTIIRAFHRLEELLRQLIDASKVVGNEELAERCNAARKLLVRDVVFAASLYT